MSQIILVIHLILAVAMICVVLLQRSEGGGLGIGGGGGGGGGMSGFLTGRGTANLLTRTTAILAACFMMTSIVLSILATGSTERRSLIDQLPPTAPVQQVPSGQPGGQTEGGPAEPSVPVQ
ncbi:MAG: preprotein translocase subunit SecG [Kiloniellales bacterium]